MSEEFIYQPVKVDNLSKADLTITQQKENEDLPKYLEKDFITKRVKACTDKHKQMLILFLFKTGVRITEAINLKKGDIDFQKETMSVRWLKNRKYKYRVLPIHKSFLELLALYVHGLYSTDKVFPYSRQRAYQITKEVLGCSPHQLRHSFAVNWLRSGGDVFILSRVMGHSRINTTMEYLKIVPVDQAKELNKIDF